MNRPAGSRRLRIALTSAAVIATSMLGAGLKAPVAHAAATTFYFHGGSADDANRTAMTPTATFDTTPPTGSTDSTQTGSVDANPNAYQNPLAVYWQAPFTGTINGTLHLDWWWSTPNAEAIALGDEITVTVYGDGTIIGQGTANINLGPTPVENQTDIPNVSGTVSSTLNIQVTVDFVDTGNANTVHYNSTSAPSFFTISSGSPTPTPTPTATPTPTFGGGNTGNQLFANYPAPTPYPHVFQPPTGVFLLFGEPSIGVDWGTTAAGNNLTMYQGDLNTWQIHFSYTPAVVPTATWDDRSDTAAAQTSLDARLINDHAGLASDRTFVEQLNGATSVQAYSDSDGGTTAPSGNAADWVTANSSLNGGVDHESIGAGRYSATNTPPNAGLVYPHAFYYCSQNILTAAFCERSDDGGLTYPSGPVQFISSSQCNTLHGKPRVGPDGAVYVPDNDCSGVGGASNAKAVVVSKDNGATWTIHNIPNTTTDPNQLDPDVAIGGGSGTGTVYFAYRDGDHHAKVVMSDDDGQTWRNYTDLGSAFGIQNAQFGEVVAGDRDRAAVTFIGTTCAGDDSVEALICNGLPAVWDLYVAFTYDGGLTWQVVDATPNDPVQRGGVCAGGTGCPTSTTDGSTSRNMLDFNDVTIDKQGRVQVAWTDGCTASCVNTPSGGTACTVPDVHNDGSVCLGRNSSLFSVSDQTCGFGLFSAFDNQPFNNDPACVSVVTPESPVATLLIYSGVVAAGIAAFVIRRRRPRKGQPAPA